MKASFIIEAQPTEKLILFEVTPEGNSRSIILEFSLPDAVFLIRRLIQEVEALV